MESFGVFGLESSKTRCIELAADITEITDLVSSSSESSESAALFCLLLSEEVVVNCWELLLLLFCS